MTVSLDGVRFSRPSRKCTAPPDMLDGSCAVSGQQQLQVGGDAKNERRRLTQFASRLSRFSPTETRRDVHKGSYGSFATVPFSPGVRCGSESGRLRHDANGQKRPQRNQRGARALCSGAPEICISPQTVGSVRRSRKLRQQARDAKTSGFHSRHQSARGSDDFLTAGGVHVPSRIEGSLSFGQYIRSIRTNLPVGAGSQFDSLSVPGESF
jgi:hypothetical protein